MKNAIEMNVHGLKCDNPKCDYINMDIKVEDYEKWINSKCPKCGEILLTEADYKSVQLLIKLTNLTNNIFGEREDDGEEAKMTVSMNGTGKMTFDIEE